jgi:outer membrane protein, heavy metal efflux system
MQEALVFLLLTRVPQDSPVLTREVAVQTAIKTHPKMQSVRQEIAAAKEGVTAARALSAPTFYVAPWLGSANGTTEEFFFSQPLEVNGARGARAAVAVSRLAASAAGADVETLSLVHAVRVAYDSLAYAQAQEALAQDSLQLTQELDRLTTRQVELGARPGIEATQTRIEVSRAQQQVIQASGQRKSAQTALAALLGKSPEETLPPLSPLPLTPAPLAEKSVPRPELTLEAANLQRLLSEEKLARTELKPDLSLMLRSQNLFHPSGQADRGAAVQVNFPLDWGAKRARVRQVAAATEAQQARQSALALQLAQERAQAKAQLESAEAVLQSYQTDLIQRSERLLQASKTGFQAGQTSITAVLESQRTYRAVLAERLAAAYAYAQARTEWERVHPTPDSLKTP